MLFDLKDIFNFDGASKDVSYELSLKDAGVSGEYPFTSPVKVFARAENKAGMVTLSLTAQFDFSAHCDRCFEPLTRHMDLAFSHRLIESLEEDFNDDYIETPEMSLELDDLVTSDIFLELPSKFLCRGDCQGLCQKCGQNLNFGECDCEKTEIDPRLAQLKELLN